MLFQRWLIQKWNQQVTRVWSWFNFHQFGNLPLVDTQNTHTLFWKCRQFLYRKCSISEKESILIVRHFINMVICILNTYTLFKICYICGGTQYQCRHKNQHCMVTVGLMPQAIFTLYDSLRITWSMNLPITMQFPMFTLFICGPWK